MNKRKRLVFPEQVKAEDALRIGAPGFVNASWIEEYDGQEVDEDIARILPDYWMEEIEGPVVLSAKDWFYDNYHSTHDDTKAGFCMDAFNEGDKNGQLREWQREEQVKLREALQMWYDIDKRPIDSKLNRIAVSMLRMAFENLKPPLED